MGPTNVVSLLATANHFQAQEVIDQCVVTMLNSIDVNTVVIYYRAAKLYLMETSVLKAALQWLEVNLFTVYPSSEKLLKQCTPDVMNDVVSSPNLVCTDEWSIYLVLCQWYEMFRSFLNN